MVRKTRANKKTSSSSNPVFESDMFWFEKNQENYEKLYIYRLVQAERRVILDELDPKIRRSFKSRGWLPLMDIEHPPATALIKGFYSNLSIHSDDSNIQYVISWIRGEEYVITPQVVAPALGVPLVWQLVYPYSGVVPFDEIMSHITSTTIRQGSDPRIITHELTELNYLFLRIACHSIWPISHLHTIPIERCGFLYALVTDAPMSFPTLFIRSLVVVYRSSSKSHGLFFLVFIHTVLLHLGLEDFPASKPVHIASIGATILRQRAAQTKASFKCPRVESSTSDASQPSFSGDPTAEEYVDPTAVIDPLPSSSSDSSISNMLDTVITVQVAHGQILLDRLTEFQTLRADLAGVRRSSPPPPFKDESRLPFGNSSQKGEVHIGFMHADRGSFFCQIVSRSFMMYILFLLMMYLFW